MNEDQWKLWRRMIGASGPPLVLETSAQRDFIRELARSLSHEVYSQEYTEMVRRLREMNKVNGIERSDD